MRNTNFLIALIPFFYSSLIPQCSIGEIPALLWRWVEWRIANSPMFIGAGGLMVFISLFFSCSKQPVNPAFTDDDITYRVVANTDSTLGEYYYLIIPNGFSPNGDGINDVFGPIGVGFISENYSMKIFNRWGNLVFETNNLNNPWDGSIGKNLKKGGAFEFRISLTNILGESNRYTGSVFIIH